MVVLMSPTDHMVIGVWITSFSTTHSIFPSELPSRVTTLTSEDSEPQSYWNYTVAVIH